MDGINFGVRFEISTVIIMEGAFQEGFGEECEKRIVGVYLELKLSIMELA